jgi:hypothetical protein
MHFAMLMLLASGLVGGAFLFGYLVGKFGEAVVETGPEARALRARLAAIAQMGARLEERCGMLEQRFDKGTYGAAELKRKRMALEQRLAIARQRASQPMRSIGPEGRARLKFVAQVINRQVQRAINENQAHASLDSSWGTPQAVEVWADNLQDARTEVQRAFPPHMGFHVMSVHIDLKDADPIDAVSA